MQGQTIGDDEKYMRRCLQLARGGEGYTQPNPMVGAVVVHNGKIIGEGFHRKCGEAHAEVNAIASVANEKLLCESTLYVSLEPCSHYGKTPPCAKLIIEKKIPRVIVATTDPFPEVSGRGIKMLQDAGIEVCTGVLEAEARTLNKHFMTMQTLGRPYIYLKWAQSADGFIDNLRHSLNEPKTMISSAEGLRLVHQLRSHVAAIMVGTNTALKDNPSLTVRHWTGQNPVRILLDRELRVPNDYNLFDNKAPTIVLTERHRTNFNNISYVNVDFSHSLFETVVPILKERHLDSLLVEGGALLHQSFLKEDLWDEIRIEVSPERLASGIQAPDISKIRSSKGIINLDANHFIIIHTRKEV